MKKYRVLLDNQHFMTVKAKSFDNAFRKTYRYMSDEQKENCTISIRCMKHTRDINIEGYNIHYLPKDIWTPTGFVVVYRNNKQGEKIRHRVRCCRTLGNTMIISNRIY